MPRVKMERGSDVQAPESEVPVLPVGWEKSELSIGIDSAPQPDRTVTTPKPSRSGYKLCLVRGNVVAEGFLDGQAKTEFQDGQIAEFQDDDIKSLPELLVPVL